MYCRLQDSYSFVRRGPCVYATIGGTTSKSRYWRGQVCAQPRPSHSDLVLQSAVSGSRLLLKLCWLTVSSLKADVPLPRFSKEIPTFNVLGRKNYSAQQIIIFLLL